MSTKKALHRFQETAFDGAFNVIYILAAGTAVGVFSQKEDATSQQIVELLDKYLKIYVSLFLVWKFNPLRSHYEFSRLDAKIGFAAGMFVLTTTTLNQYFLRLKTATTDTLEKHRTS